MTSGVIKAELERIRIVNGGVLHEEAVVEAARSPDSVLHDRFIWDDTEAAARYRLLQAQHLIRFTFTVVEGARHELRLYLSLRTDRDAAGGYRAIVDIITDEVQYKQMLADALWELEAFQRKYAVLSELKPIFQAIKAVLPSRRKRVAAAARL